MLLLIFSFLFFGEFKQCYESYLSFYDACQYVFFLIITFLTSKLSPTATQVCVWRGYYGVQCKDASRKHKYKLFKIQGGVIFVERCFSSVKNNLLGSRSHGTQHGGCESRDRSSIPIKCQRTRDVYLVVLFSKI